jgi:TolB protein
MLLRAYRLSDKLSLLILKTFAALGTMLADGFIVLFGTAGKEKRGLIGVLARILAVLGRVLMLIASALFAVFGVFFGAARRVTGSTVGGANRSVGGAMARRAARAQMDVGLAEDPLRQQNRVLSTMFVLTLVALIGVVLYATRPQSQPMTPLAVGGNFGFNDPVENSTEEPNAGVLAIATAIPTATLLPEALQARGSIAFTVRENGQNDLWAVDVASSRRPFRITNNAADERDPAWSRRDGTKLAYASNQDDYWDLYIYDTITNTTERKTVDLAFQSSPSWSPDDVWLVYESYLGNNLDVYIMAVDGSQPPQRLPGSSDMPDFSPAWSSDGRYIAFTSWMDGASQDIYVFSLDTQETFNLTNTPNRNEDFAAWYPDADSPNKGLIAYSAMDAGIEKVFVKSIDEPNSQAQVIGVGREPSWSPDGVSIIAAVDTIDSTHLTVYPYTVEGIPNIIPAPPNATSPVWKRLPLPPALVNSGGLALAADELYEERVQRAGAPPYFRMVSIGDIDVASDLGVLNDQVNDSFIALRERVLADAGWDFLGRLDDAWWDWDVRPQPGEEQCNWHLTGRAFSVTRSYALTSFPTLIEVVREDAGIDTRWQVFVRVTDEAQSGQLGEPLRKIPWDFAARDSGDVQAYEQGGKLRSQVPEGYYIDFTRLAADYGWLSYPAGSDWRLNTNAINYWMFYKPDGLNWLNAMRELYLDDQLGNCLPATPAPVVLPTAADEVVDDAVAASTEEAPTGS